MIKQLLLLIIFSIVIVFFQSQASIVLHGLVMVHSKLLSLLSMVFSSDSAGHMIKDVVAMLLVPLLVGIIVACIFWMAKRSATLQHTMLTIWIVWVVMLVAVLGQVTTTTT